MNYRSAEVPVVPMFADPNTNALLAEHGYVIIPFLDAAEIAAVEAFYHHAFPGELSGLLTSLRAPLAERSAVMRGLRELLSSPARRALQNITLVGGIFFAKASAPGTWVAPHRDFNLVDESAARSFNIWVPLSDVDTRNGCICILPDSHRRMRDVRGPNHRESIDEIRELLWERMVAVPMKAGEALIFDHSLIHGSPPNSGDRVRVGATISVIPNHVDMRMYWQSEGRLDVLRSNQEFFCEHELDRARDVLPRDDVVDYDFPIYDEAQFRAAFPAAPGRKLSG